MSGNSFRNLNSYKNEAINMDQYIFCIKCEDYVYAYCSIHGPLLVVPDSKVPSIATKIPRAALTIPSDLLHIAPSNIPGAGLGVFSLLALPVDVRFGPYEGKITRDVLSDYCWQILGAPNRTSYVIDGSDPSESNWLRYVNCSRNFAEQNLAAFQYRGQIYYRTIKVIPRGTELLVYGGGAASRRLGVDLRRYNYTTTNELTTFEKPQENQYGTMSRDLVPYHRPIESFYQDSTEFLKENYQENKMFKYDPMMIQETENHKSEINSEMDYDDSNTTLLSNESSKENFQTFGDEISHDHKLRVVQKPNTKLKCDECNFKTSIPEILEKHSKLHDLNRPYECGICRLRFSQMSQLKRHSTMHMGHTCNICENNFSSAKELLSHKSRQHTVKKVYKCNKCDFETNNNRSLNKHMNSNFTHGSFECRLCNFTTNNRLQYFAHVKTHNTDYECNMCSYKTRNGLSMAAHMEAHEKKYTCDKCDHKYSYPFQLKRHKLYRHGVK